jgi:hypothetical protein
MSKVTEGAQNRLRDLVKSLPLKRKDYAGSLLKLVGTEPKPLDFNNPDFWAVAARSCPYRSRR